MTNEIVTERDATLNTHKIRTTFIESRTYKTTSTKTKTKQRS